ncbi:MAG: PEP-CTERM sorting domain-containing protein [Candidatus Hydrogenedentes bacterium]|nr:PEP-CTERM sorting domain-containing protein [Candidatus Hydrogenedentota bacterium]
MSTHHRFLGLAVCWAALAALAPGVASATCVTLTFEGDVTCYLDSGGPGGVHSTYLDSTITLVLDLDDPLYVSSLYNGVLYTDIYGDGTVVSVTWTDSGGTVLSDDGVTYLDETFAALQLGYTYANYSFASLELSASQDPATGAFTGLIGDLTADMGGLEEIWPEEYYFDVDYFDIDGNWMDDGDTEATWRFGEWFLLDEEMASFYTTHHDYEMLCDEGLQWRYEFDGALTGFSVEGVGHVVPEPASVTLLGLGLVVAAAVRTRKRR